MGVTELTKELERYAAGYAGPALGVRRAKAAIDERQDGEPVTRIILLLDEPAADTWDVDSVRQLRHALGRKATQLGLPSISLTLVPESEKDLLDDSTS